MIMRLVGENLGIWWGLRGPLPPVYRETCATAHAEQKHDPM